MQHAGVPALHKAMRRRPQQDRNGTAARTCARAKKKPIYSYLFT